VATLFPSTAEQVLGPILVRAKDNLRASRAESTVRGDRCDFREFKAFCEPHGSPACRPRLRRFARICRAARTPANSRPDPSSGASAQLRRRTWLRTSIPNLQHGSAALPCRNSPCGGDAAGRESGRAHGGPSRDAFPSVGLTYWVSAIGLLVGFAGAFRRSEVALLSRI
jgi:hypothetical protein